MTPKDLQVTLVVTFADETANIEVSPRKVGCGIEKLFELVSQYHVKRLKRIELSQHIRLGFCDSRLKSFEVKD
jgi:hypothetical protein